MALLTESERIEILIMKGYGNRARSHVEVCQLFNQVHPQKQIVKSTVFKTCQRYQQTGHVKNLPKQGRPKSAITDEKKLEVLLHIEENPKTSTTQLALDNDISQTSVCRIFKSEKIRPYKIHFTHELTEDDPDRRIEFCEQMQETINNDPNFLRNIVFSDEATFCLNGKVNRHNCRIWSRQNPHWMEEIHTQYPKKINVWAGILGEHIIGPFFIEGTLTAERYLYMLQNEIVPAIAAIRPHANNLLIPAENVWFQQDGAPPHFANVVRNYLNNVFPRRWIGRRGPVEWPARSPDLSPLDFFLWGHTKNKVYRNRPENIGELRDRISYELQQITPIMLHNSLRHFLDRLGYCQISEGRHFEHLL